jgi:ribosomal protein S12 methylthiotransferase
MQIKRKGLVTGFVTGCLSERYRPDLEKKSNVDQYFGTTDLHY